MSDTTIETYARAFAEMARAEGVLGRVEAELHAVKTSIESDDKLRAQLTDELVPVERRQRIVEALLAGRSHGLTAQIVSFVLGAGQGRHLGAIVDRIVSIASQSAGTQMAEVRTAVALTKDQEDRLAKALAKVNDGTPVNLKVVVDPTVVGGLVAVVGDRVIDGSVRKRLDEIKGRL